MLSDSTIKTLAVEHGVAIEVIDAGYENDLLWFDGNLTELFLAIESAATAPLLARIAELERGLEEARKDAERYRFIRDADRSDCITQELSLYAMKTLDEYVDAAMEGEAELAIRAAIKEQT